MKFFHPPHLYSVTILPSKTNKPISVLNVYTSVATSWCRISSRMGKTRVVFIDPGAKVNSSHYCNITSKRVCCLTTEQYVVITGGHCSRMERASAHRPDHDGLSEKEHINFIEPRHMWPPNSPDVNSVDYAIWGAHQQRVYHQRQLKTVKNWSER